jgi:hypothetical protein
LGLEGGARVGPIHPLQQTFEIGPVHSADDVAVLLGQPVKGAVPEPDHAGLVLERLVAACGQGVLDGTLREPFAQAPAGARGDRL